MSSQAVLRPWRRPRASNPIKWESAPQELTSLLLGKEPGVNLLAFGVLLLVILRFLPNGLMGLLRGRS